MKKTVLTLLAFFLINGSVLAKEKTFPETLWKNAETREKRLKLANDIRSSLLTPIPQMMPDYDDIKT